MEKEAAQARISELEHPSRSVDTHIALNEQLQKENERLKAALEKKDKLLDVAYRKIVDLDRVETHIALNEPLQKENERLKAALVEMDKQVDMDYKKIIDLERLVKLLREEGPLTV